MDLFKLLGKIVIENDEALAALDDTNDAAEGSSGIIGALGTAASLAGTAIAAGLAAGGAAVVGIGKSAIESYANFEQLKGGIETLFNTPEAAQIVMDNAANAFQTAGMSANAYLETVTGFSAALLKSMDNDTISAAEKADMALRDMSDNANKMGTSMESLQNAYTGFSRGNFTMLDNLALGFSGTKEGMEELLAAASELSGVEYDIESYADIIDAIHVIQTDMDITGTTAKEAATTISGSFGSLKAAWQNLITGIADDNQDVDALIQNLFDTIQAAAENIIPRIGVVLEGIIGVITGLIPMIAAELPTMIMDLLPSVVEGVLSMMVALVETAADVIQPITEYLPDMIITIIETIEENLPALILGITSLILALTEAAPQILVPLIEALPEICNMLIAGLWESLPEFLSMLLPIIENVVFGVIYILVEYYKMLFQSIVDFWKSVIQVIQVIAPWINDNIIIPIRTFFADLWEKLKTGVANVWDKMKEGAANAWAGIKNVFSNVTTWFKDKFSEAWQKVKDVFSTGGAIFGNIKEGIESVFKTVVNSLIRGINVVISAPFNNINSILSTLRGISIVGVSPFKNLGSVAVPAIPELAEGGVLKKGQIGFLEGNGDEAVVPLSQNTEWIDKVADRINANGNDALLKKMDDLISAITSMNIVLDTGMMVGEMAPAMDAKLGNYYSAKGRGR